MPQEVELPDGRRVRIPDDATPEQLQQLRDRLRQEFPNAGTAAQQPSRQPEATPQQSGPWDNFLRGVDRVALTANRLNPATRASTPPVAVRAGPGGQQEVIQPIGAREGAEALLTGNEATVRSALSPVGGDYLFGAAQAMVNGDISLEGLQQGVEQQRGRRAELEGIAPAASFLAETAGFGGLYKAITKAAPALAAKAGQPITNTARAIVAGAGASGGGTLAQGGTSDEAKGAAATDALLTGALGTAGRVASPLARAAASALESVPGVRNIPGIRQGSQAAAVRAAANNASVPLDDLRAGVAEFTQLNRRPPSLAELGDAELVNALGQLGKSRRDLRPLIDEFTAAAQAGRPGEMRDAILRGREVLTPGLVSARATAQMNAAMGPIKDNPIQIDPSPQLENFMEVAQRAGIGRRLPTRVNEALTNAAGGQPLRLTVGEGDDIVRQMRNAATVLRRDGPSELANEFDAAATDLAAQIGTRQPAYRAAYRDYANHMDFVDGMSLGEGAIGRGGRGAREAVDTSQLEIASRRNPNPEAGQFRARGLKEGAVQRVAGNVEPGGAAVRREGLALGQEGRRAELTPLVGSEEVARISGIGDTQARAQAALDVIRQNALGADSGLSKRDIQDIAEAGLLIGGPGGAIPIARTGSAAIAYLRSKGLPPAASRRFVEMTLAEGRGAEAVEAMRRANLNDQQIAEFFNALGAGVAGAQGETAAEQE